ncbi:UxaA family hydrolase [Micromonospora inositola]|uniref:D-galactarate dehydratase / Altronate hydrolase, C terminus n=1 Tax=Micromonospora inositola TaxID=47865 RepID=A0A1C5JSD3_9ACTN|nr:UxaA family hydrolase [Micromonospora inositola]SCG73221.1 D-galactarate dehydratase / Altronate hydrolase, C terminus [Micromonospora inositola]
MPVTVSAPQGGQVKAWRVDGAASERRLFLVNKGDQRVSVDVAAPGARYEIDRMTPDDPSDGGRNLDAPGIPIDGRTVNADGSWPGFRSTVGEIHAGHLQITLGAGETAVVTLHGHDEEMGRQVYDLLLEVASGRRSASEELALGGEEIVPWQLGAVL